MKPFTLFLLCFVIFHLIWLGMHAAITRARAPSAPVKPQTVNSTRLWNEIPTPSLPPLMTSSTPT